MNGKYDRIIDQYVPEGISLTKVQQGYLSAVVNLYKKQKSVRMVELARHMDKSSSAVSSANISKPSQEANCQMTM